MSICNTRDKLEITAADWRARAKHIRNLAIGMMDNLTIARMEELACTYDDNAVQADAATGRDISLNGEAHDHAV